MKKRCILIYNARKKIHDSLFLTSKIQHSCNEKSSFRIQALRYKGIIYTWTSSESKLDY